MPHCIGALDLACHPGQIFSRDQLLDKVWRYDFYGDAGTVTVLVRRLREKIETDPADPQYIPINLFAKFVYCTTV